MPANPCLNIFDYLFELPNCLRAPLCGWVVVLLTVGIWLLALPIPVFCEPDCMRDLMSCRSL